MLNQDILHSCANEFNKIAKYNYRLVLGNAKKEAITIDIRFPKENFTHIVGLDHLTDIDEFNTHKSTLKAREFQRILSGKITLDDIKERSEMFNRAFAGTYNTLTKSEYMPEDRISALNDISYLMEQAYKGKLYKWDKDKCDVILKDGRHRRSNINADYMLVVQSPKNSDEKIFIFMVMSYNQKQKDVTQLDVISAFPDCIDISIGQISRYTILKEDIIDVRTNRETNIFTHSNYILKDGIDSSSSQAVSQAPNINKVTFMSPSEGDVLSISRQRAEKSFLSGIKDFFARKIEGVREIRALKKEIKALSEKSERDNQAHQEKISKLGEELERVKGECKAEIVKKESELRDKGNDLNELRAKYNIVLRDKDQAQVSNEKLTSLVREVNAILNANPELKAEYIKARDEFRKHGRSADNPQRTLPDKPKNHKR